MCSKQTRAVYVYLSVLCFGGASRGSVPRPHKELINDTITPLKQQVHTNTLPFYVAAHSTIPRHAWLQGFNGLNAEIAD